jgi:OOP family OmpA-OmpF porin
VTPMLAPDNRTLFFASNGHDGMGSFDIFKSERLDDSWRKWSEPENLGAFINSDGADMSFSFLPESEYAFMTSTIDSEGYSDIKRVRISSKFKIDTTKLERTEPVAVLRTLPDPEEALANELSLDNIMYYSGVIMNRKDRSPVVGDVRFEGDGGLVIEAKSFVDGQFKVELPKDHIWEMTIVAASYLKVDSTFEVGSAYDDQQINAFYLEPLTVGNKIKLSNVLFYRGSANLVEGSEKEIQLLAETMRQNPNMEILLGGHTDNRGNFDLNIELSQKRVAVVQDQLVRMGVDASRIVGKGFGGTRPIGSNDAERTRMLNRRVEFTVVKN